MKTRKHHQTAKPARAVLYCGDCECGKRRYETKADAKKVMRQLAREGDVYLCGDFWHYGRLPYMVKRGILDRRDLARRRL